MYVNTYVYMYIYKIIKVFTGGVRSLCDLCIILSNKVAFIHLSVTLQNHFYFIFSVQEAAWKSVCLPSVSPNPIPDIVNITAVNILENFRTSRGLSIKISTTLKQ